MWRAICRRFLSLTQKARRYPQVSAKLSPELSANTPPNPIPPQTIPAKAGICRKAATRTIIARTIAKSAHKSPSHRRPFLRRQESAAKRQPAQIIARTITKFTHKSPVPRQTIPAEAGISQCYKAINSIFSRDSPQDRRRIRQFIDAARFEIPASAGMVWRGNAVLSVFFDIVAKNTKKSNSRRSF